MLDDLIRGLILTSLIVVFFAGLHGCTEGRGGGITGTHDVTGFDQTIRVTTYPDVAALNRAKDQVVGGPADEVEGYAVWRMDAIGNVKRCDIHVVAPRGKFDYNAMETWGHELFHCMYGSYHAEGER